MPERFSPLPYAASQIRPVDPQPQSQGRHRRTLRLLRGEDSPCESRSTNRLRRTGVPATLTVVGLISFTMLFNPFSPRLVPTTNAAQHDPHQIDLGPLPFDTYAPPAPTSEPHRTPGPTTTPSEAPSATPTPAVPTHSAQRATHRPPAHATRPPTELTQQDRTPVRRLEPTRSLLNGPTAYPSDTATASVPVSSAPVLPRPPVPRAALSSASIVLGAERSGSFNVGFSPGIGTWSATDTTRVKIDANGEFTVNAPRSEPGCQGRGHTESDTISISWQATNTGDGATTAGTTTASGTLALTVSWDIAADKGTWVVSPTASGGGYWSNCSPH